MDIKESINNKGLKLLQFKDTNGDECSIQESSVDDTIYLGFSSYNRMNLSKEEVKALLPYLNKYVETGFTHGPDNSADYEHCGKDLYYNTSCFKKTN